MPPFVSSDISLTAALILNGHEPIERLIADGRRYLWKFEPSPALQAVVEAYVAGTLVANIREHLRVVRSLAAPIRDARRR